MVTYATVLSLKFTVCALFHQLFAKCPSRIQDDERWTVGLHAAERLVVQASLSRVVHSPVPTPAAIGCSVLRDDAALGPSHLDLSTPQLHQLLALTTTIQR